MPSKFITDLTAVFRSKVFNIILSIATGIIYARVLGPEGDGLLAGVLIYPAIFISFSTLGLRQSAVYFIGNGTEPTKKIVSSILTVWILTSIVSVIACAYILKFIAGNSYSTIMIALAVSAIPFMLYKDYMSGILLGKDDIKRFANITWLSGFFRLLGAILFVWYFEMGVLGALIAPVFVGVTMSLILTNLVRRYTEFSLSFNKEIIKRMVALGIVYSISLFVINLNYKVDRMLLEYLSTPFELGIYTRGVGLVERIWQIPLLLGTIIFAGSANAKNSLKYSIKVAKLLRVSLLVCFLALCFLALFSSQIVNILYGIEYENSAIIIRILAPGILFMVFFKVLNMDLAGRGKPWLALIAMGPSVLINIALNIFFIPKYGASGVAIASTISYSIGSFIFLFVYSNNTGLSVKDILMYKYDDFHVLIQKVKRLKKR
ncbi:MAG: O-antigen translocase [Balneolaceae bacterium]